MNKEYIRLKSDALQVEVNSSTGGIDVYKRQVLSCCVAFFPLLFVKQKMAIFLGAALRVFAWLLHQTGWKERLVQ